MTPKQAKLCSYICICAKIIKGMITTTYSEGNIMTQADIGNMLLFSWEEES